MKFVYGKQDWKTFERGEENCFLMTNGLGGFSSLTMIGSCGRNDHAVLMACVHSPNHRYNMIHRLEEILFIGEEEVHLSSQDYLDEAREQGFLYQTKFTYEDYPRWTYLVKGIEIVRTMVLSQGENSVGISYEIRNHSGKEAVLEVYPHLEFVPKGALLTREQAFTLEEGKISSNGQTLHFWTDGDLWELPLTFREGLYYAYDHCDGRRETGRTAVNHKISRRVGAGAGGELEMVYGMLPRLSRPARMREEMCRYRETLREKAGFADDTARTLAAAAGQFISYRSSTAKQTILAGFPFFEDWGRDTMIAMLGCCLATGQYETAESTLLTFMPSAKRA